MNSPEPAINDVLTPPQIGLGTFPFSGVFSTINQEEACGIVQKFLALGGRYLETAPVYPVRDVSLGAILSDLPRESFFIATKCVTGADAKGNKVRSGKREVVLAQCEAEISRLSVDSLDLLQAHIVAEDVPIEETARTLQELKQAGLTRFIGVSNVTLSQLREYTRYAEIDLVQNRFSFIHRPANRSIEVYCEEKGIFLNPYQVIERGQLTSRALTQAAWRDGDLRRTKHEYIGEAHQTILQWVSTELAPISRDLEVSIEALVLAWTLRQPRMLVPVVGATRRSQVMELLKANKVVLDDEAMARLDAAYASLESGIRERYGLPIDEYRGL